MGCFEKAFMMGGFEDFLKAVDEVLNDVRKQHPAKGEAMASEERDEFWKTAREMFKDLGGRREYEYIRIPLADGGVARVTFTREPITLKDIEKVMRTLTICAEGMEDKKA